MTRFTKERFRAICGGDRPGDFGILGNGFHFFYPETLPRWVEQGAPPILATPWSPLGNEIPQEVVDYFQFDESRLLWEVHSGLDGGTVIEDFRGVPLQDESFLVCPPIGPTLLQESQKDIILINRAGIKERVLKANSFNMPMWLEHPVKDRASWNDFKVRLDPATPERYPADWQAFVEKVNAYECPIGMQVGGFFGFINMWVGTQNLMYMFYDDPSLVDEMMETVLQLELEMVKRVTRDIKLDFAWYWEDMAYKSGPMIGPETVRQYMLPRYKQLNETLSRAGCDICYLDSDGNLDLLIPVWLEAGIRLIWPLELTAGMDPFALRRKYGKEIILGGGLDRRKFTDKSALKEEVLSKVPQLASSGPYFPSPDHSLPQATSFENFCYYINLLREVRGDEPINF